MFKLCPNCKNPVPEEASFCLYCFTGGIRGVSQKHKDALDTLLKEEGFSCQKEKLRKTDSNRIYRKRT